MLQTDNLFHYCNLDSLLGIVTNRCLWANDYKYMNDYEELKGAKKRVGDFIDDIYQEIDGAPSEHIVKEMLNKLLGQEQKVHIVSFSTGRDKLSQWRGYGENGRGVCLGFKRDALKSLGYTVCDAIYGDTKFVNAISAECKKLSNLKITTDLEKDEVYRTLIKLAASYKSSSFEEENEARLIVFSDTSLSDIKFRRSKDFIVPYFEVKLDTVWGSQLISEVIVGPANKDDHTKESIREFIVSKNLNGTAITKSSATFRD